MAFGLVILGLIVMTAGAEVLVRGAVGLAKAFGMPSLIVGLTVVAYGTSAPELAVSIKACYTGQTDIALGNALGSNIFNVLFILGVSALVAPLIASKQLIRLDVPIMIGVSLIMWALAADGSIGRIDGGVLVLGLFFYTLVLIVLGRRQTASKTPDQPVGSALSKPTSKYLVAFVKIAIGLVLLVIGARWLVDGAVTIAQALGASELLIALTIVAAGTSMPELATSIVASLRGQRDIAIGNVVGSNIFNLLGVLGVSAVIAPNGVVVASAALGFDIPVAVAVACACLPIFFTGGRISRWEGGLFLAYYAAYVTILILAATRNPALESFNVAMFWFVIPLTTLGLAVSVKTWVCRKRECELVK